ncbi:hypothetical protein J6590_011567 [Homalodisca vitripennis]|nr:hypothetical protein J6590_011567 [Homalodisca vitripennis]
MISHYRQTEVSGSCPRTEAQVPGNQPVRKVRGLSSEHLSPGLMISHYRQTRLGVHAQKRRCRATSLCQEGDVENYTGLHLSICDESYPVIP